MALDITKEQLKFFEKYLEEHPPKPGYDEDTDEFDGDLETYDHQASCSRLVKLLLEGKIK